MILGPTSARVRHSFKTRTFAVSHGNQVRPLHVSSLRVSLRLTWSLSKVSVPILAPQVCKNQQYQFCLLPPWNHPQLDSQLEPGVTRINQDHFGLMQDVHNQSRTSFSKLESLSIEMNHILSTPWPIAGQVGCTDHLTSARDVIIPPYLTGFQCQDPICAFQHKDEAQFRLQTSISTLANTKYIANQPGPTM